MGHCNAPFLDALCQAALPRLDSFNAQAVGNMVRLLCLQQLSG